MAYQWNRDKALSNVQKHDIDFADAISIFSDNFAITIFDERFGEDRFVTIGMDAFARVLVVVYTYREQDIRIISARKATKTECAQYAGDD